MFKRIVTKHMYARFIDMVLLIYISQRAVKALQQELDVRQRAIASKLDRPKSAKIMSRLSDSLTNLDRMLCVMSHY